MFVPMLPSDCSYLMMRRKARAPETFETKKATGRGIDHLHFRVQVDPLDCTGCANCADVCPAKGKALVMQPAEQEIRMQEDNWEFAMTVSVKDDLTNTNTLKGKPI